MPERPQYIQSLESLRSWVFSKLPFDTLKRRYTRSMIIDPPVPRDWGYEFTQNAGYLPNIESMPCSQLVDDVSSGLNVDSRLDTYLGDKKRDELVDHIIKTDRRIVSRVSSHGLEIIIGTTAAGIVAVGTAIAVHRYHRDHKR